MDQPNSPGAPAVPSRTRVAISVARCLVAALVLFVVYAIVPAPGRTDAGTLALMAAGLVVFIAILAYQLWSIMRSENPVFRAAEALIVTFVALVVGFAYGYLSLAHGVANSFSEHLDKVAGVYFALTVITTVGFGDIVPVTDWARVLVSVQYVVDLLLIVGIARLFVNAAQLARRQREHGRSGPRPEPESEPRPE